MCAVLHNVPDSKCYDFAFASMFMRLYWRKSARIKKPTTLSIYEPIDECCERARALTQTLNALCYFSNKNSSQLDNIIMVETHIESGIMERVCKQRIMMWSVATITLRERRAATSSIFEDRAYEYYHCSFSHYSIWKFASVDTIFFSSFSSVNLCAQSHCGCCFFLCNRVVAPLFHRHSWKIQHKKSK